MRDAHNKYLKSVENRISSAKINQLAMAAPLESSSAPRSSRNHVAPEQRKPAEADPGAENQQFGLVHALLSVGALKSAIAVLTQYRWMVDAYPALADLMIRVLKHSIAPLWASYPQNTKSGLASFTKPRARYGATGVAPAADRRPQLTLTAPTPPSTSQVDFVFFYPQWSERVPLCSTIADLIDVVEPLMRFIGLHISRDPHFINKLVRLGRIHLQVWLPTFGSVYKVLTRLV